MKNSLKTLDNLKSTPFEILLLNTLLFKTFHNVILCRRVCVRVCVCVLNDRD